MKYLFILIVLFVACDQSPVAPVSSSPGSIANPDTVIVAWSTSESDASDLFVYANDDLRLVIFEQVSRAKIDTLFCEHGARLRAEYYAPKHLVYKKWIAISSNGMRWFLR